MCLVYQGKDCFGEQSIDILAAQLGNRLLHALITALDGEVAQPPKFLAYLAIPRHWTVILDLRWRRVLRPYVFGELA